MNLPAPLLHPKTWFEVLIIQTSKYFDPAYYRQRCPESRLAQAWPALHYTLRGWKAGKNPSPCFDTAYYLRQYPDVRQAGINPLAHYLRAGRAEGRLPRQADRRIYPRYPLWVRRFDTLQRGDRRRIKKVLPRLESPPKLTLFYIVQPNQPARLRASLKALQNQLYPHWEMVLFLGPDVPSPAAGRTLRKALRDPRIRQAHAQNSLQEALNQALQEVSGGFLGLTSQKDVLPPHALYCFGAEAARQPNLALLYSDEDRTGRRGRRTYPYFKPDYNPELLCYQDYINHFALFRTDAVRQAGGFGAVSPPALNWDLALRISEAVPPEAIRHLPHVLCHRAPERPGRDPAASQPHKEVLAARARRLGGKAGRLETRGNQLVIRYPLPDPAPLVSLIIPTRNNPGLLSRCLKSIARHTRHHHYEILIVDNRSDDPETLALLIRLTYNDRIRVLSYPKPFNYAAINNFAVERAEGDVLVFCNDDVELITDGWLEILAGHALRPEIGAVGPMLYYPNDTIQHAGVVLGLNGVAGHIYQGQPRGYQGVRQRAALPQNLTALTAACMAVQRDKFLRVRGFDADNLPIAFNDIDLCIRLFKAGYLNLWTPQVEGVHHESVTRGADDTPQKQARFAGEVAYMLDRYGDLLTSDPVYNPNFSLVDYDCKLAFPPRVARLY